MIIVEGIDGVGKSTFVQELSLYGYKRHHFNFDEKNMNLYLKYSSVLSKSDSKTALDRSFISEMVYGPVIRGGSKLTDFEFIQLLKSYGNNGFKLFYLHATKKCLLERRASDFQDYEMLLKYGDALLLQYEKVIKISRDYLDIIFYNTELLSIDNMINDARKNLKL